MTPKLAVCQALSAQHCDACVFPGYPVLPADARSTLAHRDDEHVPRVAHIGRCPAAVLTRHGRHSRSRVFHIPDPGTQAIPQHVQPSVPIPCRHGACEGVSRVSDQCHVRAGDSLSLREHAKRCLITATRGGRWRRGHVPCTA